MDGKPHDHSFLRDGDEKRIVKVLVDGGQGKDKLVGNVSAGINDLLGSFHFSFYLWLTVLTVSRNSAEVDGVSVRKFRPGRVYDVGRGR